MAETGASKGVLESIFGSKKRTTDIHLPNESGKVDPRIAKAKKKKSLLEKISINPFKEYANKVDKSSK